MELQPGTILKGRYCVDRLMAEGGMSRLYEGHPLEGAGLVAIKQLALVDGDPSDEDLEQFQKEYAILRGLSHEGLARALDFFTEGGQHYLVEEFVAGDTLEARVQAAGRLPVEEAGEFTLQLLDVLSYLHVHGIVYRDLKPSNVIVQREGNIRLVDFGAARRWKREATQDTLALGTPGYAAPEQYGQAQSDARSDVYGAGVLLHYMLTGRAPDPSAGWRFEPPHALVPEVKATVGNVVMKAVETSPEKRFQTAKDMARALEDALGRPGTCMGCRRPVPPGHPLCDACSNAPSQVPPKQQGCWGCLVPAVLALLLVWIGSAIMVPGFIRSRPHGQSTACKSNLKNIGTALEMYSTDNAGRFPRDLNALTPNYLKVIPTCPSAGTNTYTERYMRRQDPDAYTVMCSGRHHEDVGQGDNYPQYSSVHGLIAK